MIFVLFLLYSVGFRKHAEPLVLVHEPAGLRDMAVHGRRIHSSVDNNMDSGEVFTVRMVSGQPVGRVRRLRLLRSLRRTRRTGGTLRRPPGVAARRRKRFHAQQQFLVYHRIADATRIRS